VAEGEEELSELTEARPAKLPLSGGAEGASVTVRPFLTAELALPPRFYDRPKGRLGRVATLLGAVRGPKHDWDYCPVPAFLVEHPVAGNLMIDTGLHRCCAQPGGENLGMLARFSAVRMNPGQSAAERLRARGIEPDSIGLVVMTHLHNDHASATTDFPNATFICDQTEWRAAHSKGANRNGYVNTHLDIAVDWRLVDYGKDPVESFAGFARTLDLFGDGSVRLISTPGHSAGHQSVLLRLAHGELLVIGDAAPTEEILEGSKRPFLNDDDHLAERSLRELRSYRRLTPNALMVPGHDTEAWNRLDSVYGGEAA